MRSWSVTTGVCTGTKSGCEGAGDGRRPARGVLGELCGSGQLGHVGQLRQFHQLVEGLGGVEVHRVQAREVRLAGHEERRVLARPGQAAQQGRGVGGVTGFLGGPEGAGLGELALALLGQRFGDGRAYLGDRGDGAAALRGHGGAVDAGRGQLRTKGRDLLAQPVSSVQSSGAHGRGGGGGQQQGKRHGAH